LGLPDKYLRLKMAGIAMIQDLHYLYMMIKEKLRDTISLKLN
jgi:hypothetical protein